MTVPREGRIRIISSGSGATTRVYLMQDGGGMTDITRDVKSVVWSLEGRGAATVTLVCKSAQADLVGALAPRPEEPVKGEA